VGELPIGYGDLRFESRNREEQRMTKRGLLTCGLSWLMVLGACSGEPNGAEELGEVSQSVVQACTVDSDCLPAVTGRVCSPVNGCVSPAGCYTASGPGVVVGDVVVDDVDPWGDLSVLAGAWCVSGNLTFKNTPLFLLEQVKDLVAVGNTLTVTDNPYLDSLWGFDNLRQALKLTVLRNGNLRTLEGAPRLKTLSSLQVYANPRLQDLWGLQNLTRFSWAEVVNNASLRSLGGLNNVTLVSGYLDIRQNPKLVDLQGLGSVATVGNLVQIMDNPGLLTLDGMPNLRLINSTLRVQRNPALETLSALNGLTSVPTFQVSDNPKLDACELGELATKVSANCSGCVNNGPCGPRLSLTVQGVTDYSKYNEFPYGTTQPGDTLAVELKVFNRSQNPVVLSPARITVNDTFVMASGSAPFLGSPANTVPPSSARYASPWFRLANDAPMGHVVNTLIEVDWTANGQSGTISQSRDVVVDASSYAYGNVYLALRQYGDNLPENGAGQLDGRLVPGERVLTVFALQNLVRSPMVVNGLRLVTDNPYIVELATNVEPGTIVGPADTLFIEPTFLIASNATAGYAYMHFELDYEQNGQPRTANSSFFWPQITVP
jgi:hypothetical protein